VWNIFIRTKTKITEKKEERETKNTERDNKKKISSPSYEKYDIYTINKAKCYRRIVKNHKIIFMFFFPEKGGPNNQDRKKKYKKSKWGNSRIYNKSWEQHRIEKIDRKYRK
jgi:hypothetical protein